MGHHGPQFDEFTAQSGEHRGGAVFDEHHGGPAANAGTDAVTQTYRETTANGSGHGARWDEFGWRQMPEHYGRFMDSDFRQPAEALQHGHGTWQDVFRGGTEVRVEVDGIHGLEAVVTECHADHAVIELRGRGRNDGGGRREVNIGQIKEWRTATAQGQASETRKPAASPGNTPAKDKASTAEAPSAHNRTARGGGRTDLDVTAGQSIFTTVKTSDDELDVAKAAGFDVIANHGDGPSYISKGHCSSCTSHFLQMHREAGASTQKVKSNVTGTCASCSNTIGKAVDEDVDVAKTLEGLRRAAGIEG